MNLKKAKARPFSSAFLSIKIKLVFTLFWFVALNAGAQNYHCKHFPFQQKIELDSFSVDPESVTISPPIPFQLSGNQRFLIVDTTKHSSLDSLEICFRSLSPHITKARFSRNINEYNRSIGVATPRAKSINLEDDTFLQMGTLKTNGAISRGITVGNQQNVFVNSALNLQIEGQLTDDLKIAAVITDQNIPYQPEGNTQQLRDFDNVYIQLFNEQFDLRAGDIVLQNPVENSYFLKYYKNVQGLQIGYNSKLKHDWLTQSQLSISLSKGQFASVVVDAIDGVQGPYKLRGANGERFIVILANSEKVYLDGKLLNRGFDQDYIIDYNLGEITFSPKTIITRFSRIRVDYEFANQNYSRSNLSAAHVFQNEKTKLYFNYYREKDNRNNALSFNINERDQLLLRGIGDQNGIATISGIDSTGFQENALLYSPKDTVVSGVPFRYYKYDPERGTYQISFTAVSAGAYNLVSETTNGKVYEWVGAGLGAYEPVRVITLPNEKQVAIFGAAYQLSTYETFYQELAFSQFDQNLFSNIQDQDNNGWAWKGGMHTANRTLGWAPDYKLIGEVNFEFDQTNFRAIDRFRDIDYDRSWNYDVFSDSATQRADHILSAELGLQKDPTQSINYSFGFRDRYQVINGFQQLLSINQRLGPFQYSSVSSLSSNDLELTSSRWSKSEQRLILISAVVKPGYIYTLDQQQTIENATKDITNTKMNYQSHDWFLQSGDSLKSLFRFDYIRRTDRLPVNGEFQRYTDAQEFRLTYSGRISGHQIGGQLNFRKVSDHLNPDQSDDQLLGKLSWKGDFVKHLIQSNLTYSTASVRELKRTYVYVNVPTGQGTHTWRDENNDGIQDINEFYDAVNVDEKNYVKIFTPTDEYLNAFQSLLIHTLDIRLPNAWKSGGWFVANLAKLSMNANVRTNLKTTSDRLVNRLNPIKLTLSGEDLVSAKNNYRGSVFYNRNGQGLSLEFSRTRQDQKNLLSGGFEQRIISGWEGGYRFTFNKSFSIRGISSQRENSNVSDFLSSRNFVLSENGIENQIVWQPGKTFRIIGGVDWRKKNNQSAEDEWSEIRELSGEWTWMKSSKSNFNINLSWLEIGFSGEKNSYVGYELLEALQPGTNQKWNVNWQQSLKKGLQLTLQYYGRKSETSPVIHTGNMMVTAFF